MGLGLADVALHVDSNGHEEDGEEVGAATSTLP
jgi:hypothetical protein